MKKNMVALGWLAGLLFLATSTATAEQLVAGAAEFLSPADVDLLLTESTLFVSGCSFIFIF